ncbi:MAG: nuclear transport factor 2 family protein [Hyphomicrobiales bacterium]
MSAFETATKFFHACESLEGWAGCRDYVADGAKFTAQSEPLVDVHSVEDYCEWMAGLGKGPLEGCSYDLHSSSYDDANRTAIFFATFTGTHVGDGGPVPPTGRQANAEYVYALKMDPAGKVESMCKVWNAPWTLKELGWA